MRPSALARAYAEIDRWADSYADLVAERDRYYQALVDIAGYEGWESHHPTPKAMGNIARKALGED